jgi:hypothetical protein
MKDFTTLLSGGDLRSIGKSNEIVALINSQEDFDSLFYFLFSNDRLAVMRAADSIEKITKSHSLYLQPHAKEIVQLMHTAKNKELKWHLALLLSRLNLTNEEAPIVYDALTRWFLDKQESKIVRVNALQCLYHLAKRKPSFQSSLQHNIQVVARENIPSINARIHKLSARSAHGG